MTLSSLHRFTGMALLPISMAVGMIMSTSAYADTTANQAQAVAQPAKNADGIIALVNDNAILKSDLINGIVATQQRAKAIGRPLPNAERLQNDVLNALILRELQLSLINRIGLKPDETVINQQLAQIAQAEGLSSIRQLQQQMDAKQSGSYASLRQRLIEDASIQALQQRQIASRVRITEQDIDAFLASPEAKRLNQGEYQTYHVRIPFVDDYNRLSESQRATAVALAQKVKNQLSQPNADIAEILQGAGKDYPLPVQGGDMGYHKASTLPTELASTITSLNVGEVSDLIITPKGIDVVKLANQRNTDDLVIPQWHVRHILIKADDNQSNALAQQKINDLYEQLRQGASFPSLAATYSDDIGSAGREGDLDWVSEGEMVAPFEQMMKQTPVGDFSTPFQTQFGWHVLQVVDQRQQDVSEQYKRNLAREALYQRLAPQAKEDWLQELRAGAYVKILN